MSQRIKGTLKKHLQADSTHLVAPEATRGQHQVLGVRVFDMDQVTDQQFVDHLVNFQVKGERIKQQTDQRVRQIAHSYNAPRSRVLGCAR